MLKCEGITRIRSKRIEYQSRWYQINSQKFQCVVWTVEGRRHLTAVKNEKAKTNWGAKEYDQITQWRAKRWKVKICEKEEQEEKK